MIWTKIFFLHKKFTGIVTNFGHTKLDFNMTKLSTLRVPHCVTANMLS